MSTDIKITAIEEDFESSRSHAFIASRSIRRSAAAFRNGPAHVTEKLRLTHGVIDDATFESLWKTK